MFICFLDLKNILPNIIIYNIMCWNEAVSMNTFLFSSFLLLLIIYNNSFTKYKIKDFNNKWTYVFFASFILMQLIEFFIWRNINNKYYNSLFSKLALCLLLIQPIASMMIIQKIPIRNILLFFYLLIMIPFSIHKFSTNNIYSKVYKNGHLSWFFFGKSYLSYLIISLWFFFFFFSFIYEKIWGLFIFGIITLIICFIQYYFDTAGSVWCWSINSLMIYYAIYLLLFLPFLEKMQIC